MRVYAVNKACHADETAIRFVGIQSNSPGLVVKVVLLEEGGRGEGVVHPQLFGAGMLVVPLGCNNSRNRPVARIFHGWVGGGGGGGRGGRQPSRTGTKTLMLE